MVSISPSQDRWPREFRSLGQVLRRELGSLALRIDHIGSTAVPGLAAKDRIDIQVTVAELSPAVETAIERCGYRRNTRISGDHLPPGETQSERWRKWIFKHPDDQPPVNLHVRLAGLPNQRYPLLFRDYLRAHPQSAAAYAQVKQALIRHHPEEDMEVYYDVKDPVCDLIYQAAEAWAAANNWILGESDC